MKVSLHSFCRDYDLAKSSVFRRCKELNIDTSEGLTDEDCDRLLQEFGVSKHSATPPVNVAVEVGNHQIMLTQPELPQSYSLEGLRTSEVMQFDDPLALANQFLQVADQLQTAMQADIEQREAKLQQTQKAKSAIADKAVELKLEARLYKERAHMLDRQQTQETETLQQSLSLLQQMGKPQDPGNAG